MAPVLHELVRAKAYRIVFWQFLGVLLLSFGALLIKGSHQGFSALCGGIAYVLPNLIFVWLVFRYARPTQMTQFMVAFMLGEAFKLILSGILFLIIVKTLPVSLLSVALGFIGAIVSFWIVSFWQFGTTRGATNV